MPKPQLSMNLLVARISLLPVLALMLPAAHGEGRFDLDTGLVQFPCVSVVGDPYYWRGYALTLAPQGDDSFAIARVQDTYAPNGCDASYNAKTNTLLSEVRVVDDIYDVALLFDPAASTFSLASAEYLRLSETALWIVSNGVNKLYLGGTIHVLRASEYPLHAALLQAYELAEAVVFEYDPAIPITSADVQGFYLPEGESLLDYTSPSIELHLDEYLQQFDRTLENYVRRKPRFFNNDLYYLGARSYGYTAGVDFFFMDLARADGKPTGGLETVADQVKALVESSDDANTDWNFAFIQRLAYIKSGLIDIDLKKLIGEWREGRLEWMTASNNAYQQVFPRQYESILAKRNRNWIPVIEAYLETPETELILAGFSHFAGPDNVLELLAAKGYTIEQYVIEGSPFDDLSPAVIIDVSLY